jgi:alkylhydroperoxidase family enzyme
MSRIPPVEHIQLPTGEMMPFSTMSTLFRTMAHRPEIMQRSMQLLEAVMHTGTVEPRLKELLAVRVSQVNYCFY